MIRRITSLTVAALLAAAALGTGTATAAPDDAAALTAQQRERLDAKAEAALAASPGGRRTAVNEIVWADKGAVLTLALPGQGTRANRSCNSGETCLYSGDNWDGDQLSFYKCKFQKLRWYNFTNRTSSWDVHQTGSAESDLAYWEHQSVLIMSTLHTGGEVLHYWKNNEADFLRVC